jgi:CRP-like cAMP-binding protein
MRTQAPSLNAHTFLHSAGKGKRVVTYARGDIVFSQGDPADSVMYIRTGAVQLSVLSKEGKEAIVGTLDAGDFLGEGALKGHPFRLVTARAAAASTVLVVPKRQMIRLLHTHHAFSDRFISHMLGRNERLEADLVDQLFNSSEKRLARTLLLLARGTTRSRVNVFMNKFKKLGFIEYNGSLTINPSLVTVVVHTH